MSNKTCFLILWGSMDERDVEALRQRSPEDVIYCADSGYDSLAGTEIVPDLLLGDLDSIRSTHLPKELKIVKAPAEKDDTDALLAAKTAYDAGFRNFRILGGLGGRLDHTVGNIGVLAWLLEAGATATIRDADCEARLLRNGTVELWEESRKYLSIFPYSDVCEGVTLKGVKYPLDRYTMVKHIPIGVSNEICGKASVTVEKGTLLILRTKMS